MAIAAKGDCKMEMLYHITQAATFVLGVSAVICVGIRLLPAAELLFSDDLPEDVANEA
jgi:hypothetical protein